LDEKLPGEQKTTLLWTPPYSRFKAWTRGRSN